MLLEFMEVRLTDSIMLLSSLLERDRSIPGYGVKTITSALGETTFSGAWKTSVFG
jgi:hypothetical protein